ncbi:MAG: dethiobiotin synthase [Holosporales bacterium]|jgi:dethiobiotin synthase|nr:dethiobiotin synthase [Holosporales bacterium]
MNKLLSKTSESNNLLSNASDSGVLEKDARSNIFITGTDTNVGKTIISSWICLHSGAKYWKPVQTGHDSDSQTVRRISPSTEIIPEAYKLKAPLSAYDAANAEHIKIDPRNILEKIPNGAIIEGAGGALVPISEGFFMADLIKQANCNAIIVARSKLGFQNHIYLTIEALNARGINIIGIILNGCSSLIPTIEHFSGVRVLHVFSWDQRNLSQTIFNTALPQEILRHLRN